MRGGPPPLAPQVELLRDMTVEVAKNSRLVRLRFVSKPLLRLLVQRQNAMLSRNGR